MKIIEHTVFIDDAITITGLNILNKTCIFKEHNGLSISIPFRTVLRLIAIAEKECERNGIDYQEFINSCMKD